MTTRWPAVALSLLISVATLTNARAAGLESVLARAAMEDPAIAEARAAADRAAADVVIARAALLPSVDAAASYTRNQVAAEVAVPGGDPLVVQPLDQLDASVEARLTLVDGGAWSALTAAGRCRDAAADRAEDAVNRALLEVARLAWDARAAALAVEVARSSLAASEAVRDRALARREAGAGSVLDALRAEADVQGARESLALAEAEAAAVGRALAARAGTPEVPADLAPRPFDGGGDAVAAAARAAAADAACRDARLAQQRWTYAPTVGAFARERLTNATGFADRPDQWAAGVDARFTLFAGGARAGRVAAAAADAREAEARARRIASEVEVSLADALGDQAAARAALEAATARRAAAAEALRVASERYEAGTGPALDVSAALRDDRDAALAQVRAESRFAVAAERARAAAGEPLVGGGR